MTPESLYRAFQTAAAIHAQITDEVGDLGDPKYNYLTLVCVGTKGWAATFDTVSADDEWYEMARIDRYPHSARSADPAAAIMEAAVKLIEDLQLPMPV